MGLRSTSTLLFAMASAAAMALPSCSSAPTVKAADPVKNPKPAADANPGPTDTESDSSDTSDSGSGLDLETAIKQCGVTTEQLQDPTTVLLDKTVTSWPKLLHGTFNKFGISGNYVVSIKTHIHIHATLNETLQETSFDVSGSPQQAVDQAKAQVQGQNGNSLSKSLSTQERAELMGKNKEWAGVLCTISPTREVQITRGGTKKVLTFDPPLPSSVSPKADPARYQAEIGSGRTFTNIKLTVSESVDPAVPPGQSVTGTVTITPVTPTLTLDAGTSQQTFQTDMAYKIDIDFGGPAQTAKLGLLPSAVFFVSNQARDLKVIVADTQDATMGTIVLSDQLQ